MTIVWAGLALGSIYAIAALLYNITIANAGVFNFAASQFILIGAFAAAGLSGALGLPWLLAIPVGAVVGAVIGFLTELAAIRPLKDKTGWAPLVTTVGAAFVIEGIAFAVWGAEPYTVAPPWDNNTIVVFGGTVSPADFALMALAVVLCLAFHFAHRRSRWGLLARAVTGDRDAAAVRGVNTRRVVWSSFVVAGALGGAIGPLIAVKTYAVFSLGATLVIFAFVALTLGGFGSYIGCLVGGIVVGMVQAFSERYLGSNLPLIIVFGLLLFVLLVRPTGLFGDRRARLV